MGRPRSGGPRGISRVRWLSTDVVEAVVRVHGGVKFYRGAARAARAYVERDRSRADDYYLGEGTGVATRLTATPDGVAHDGELTGDAYEKWVDGIDIDTGRKKGRLRDDANALRFVEATVNGPKTWSLAAALHPEISAALDVAQDKAAMAELDRSREAARTQLYGQAVTTTLSGIVEHLGGTANGFRAQWYPVQGAKPKRKLVPVDKHGAGRKSRTTVCEGDGARGTRPFTPWTSATLEFGIWATPTRR